MKLKEKLQSLRHVARKQRLSRKRVSGLCHRRTPLPPRSERQGQLPVASEQKERIETYAPTGMLGNSRMDLESRPQAYWPSGAPRMPGSNTSSSADAEMQSNPLQVVFARPALSIETVTATLDHQIISMTPDLASLLLAAARKHRVLKALEEEAEQMDATEQKLQRKSDEAQLNRAILEQGEDESQRKDLPSLRWSAREMRELQDEQEELRAIFQEKVRIECEEKPKLQDRLMVALDDTFVKHGYLDPQSRGVTLFEDQGRTAKEDSLIAVNELPEESQAFLASGRASGNLSAELLDLLEEPTLEPEAAEATRDLSDVDTEDDEPPEDPEWLERLRAAGRKDPNYKPDPEAELLRHYQWQKAMLDQAENNFDMRDNEYTQELDQWNEKRAAGEDTESSLAFDRRHFLRVQHLTRRLIEAEVELEEAKAAAVAAGIDLKRTEDDDLESGFIDDVNDGYAPSSEEEMISASTDRPRILKWLASIPEVIRPPKAMLDGTEVKPSEFHSFPASPSWITIRTLLSDVDGEEASHDADAGPSASELVAYMEWAEFTERVPIGSDIDEWDAKSFDFGESFSICAEGTARRWIDRWRRTPGLAAR